MQLNALNTDSKPKAVDFIMWFAAVMTDWLIIVCAMSAAVHAWWLFLPAAWVIGNRLDALVIMAHENVHGNAFPNKKINDWLASICLLPVNANINGYRADHFAHHANLGHEEKDPQQKVKLSDPEFHVSSNVKKRLFRYVLDLFGYGAVYALRVSNRRAFKQSNPAGTILFYTWFLGLMIVFGWPLWPILLFPLGLVTGFPAAQRMRAWFEHDMHGNTNPYKGPWLLRLLFSPHYAHLHLEHHQEPTVPWWKLLPEKDHWTLKESESKWQSK